MNLQGHSLLQLQSITTCRDTLSRLVGWAGDGPRHLTFDAAAPVCTQAWRREEARFRRDYNDKLFNGLVVFALADILLFRFVIRVSLAETVGWVGFVFLQVRCGCAAGC